MMKVNSAVDINHYPTRAAEPKEASANKANNKKDHHAVEREIKDEYSPSKNQVKTIYEKPTYKPDTATIQKLKEESERTHNQLREMVKQLLERQGMTFKDLEGLETEIEIDEETRLKAQEMIGEGGPLSPEKVSANIVDFAKAISGGDKEKIDLLTSAIEKGFKQAANMLGGKLPEISQKTYDLVMEKIEAWREE